MQPSDFIAGPRRDPLSIDTALELHGIYHPAGFLLHLHTNSADVLEAARESWQHYPEQAHACDPIEFRVVVQPEGALAVTPVHRAHGHLYTVVSDAGNFAALDLQRLCGTIFVSRQTAANRSALRWFFVESLAYMLLAQRYVVPVHAGCVAREGRGLLLCGASTAGKSTLSYASARSGWAYLSDDAVFLLPGEERVAIGQNRQFRLRPDAPRLFPELANFHSQIRPNGKQGVEIPVADLPHVTAAERVRIDAVVLLERSEDSPAGVLPVSRETVLQRMLDDLPSYGAEVNAMHERTICRLVEVPAWRLRYSALEDALAALRQISEATR